ncbi:MAG: flippase-like domain-containing protein [Anaerolineaceae bacterium]|nr:flippase-like domain-containing protein [Anaerolineaceae bacterium]
MRRWLIRTLWLAGRIGQGARHHAQVLWLVAGLALLAAVIYRQGPGKVWNSLQDALDHPWLLAAALGLFILSVVGFFVKWHIMSRLAGAELGVRQSLRLFSTLFMIGTFTPGRAGELAVPLMMRGGARLTGVALVNRILESGITVFMGLVAFVLVFTSKNPTRDIAVLSVVLLGFVATMIVLSRRRLTEKLIALIVACLRPLRRLPLVPWLLEKERQVQGQLGPFYEANERMLRWPTVLLFCGLMLLIWLVMVAANYLLILATVKEEAVAIAHVLAVIAVVAVTIFLSPIPGGVGISEGLGQEFLRQLGYKSNFIPFLLLGRFGFYVVVVLFYLAGRLFGRELPEPDPEDHTESGAPH